MPRRPLAERNQRDRDHYAKYQDLYKRKAQEYRANLRREVIDAYGGKCACCGESELVFLAIDHPNRDGLAHRKAVNGNWVKIYLDLKKRGYPEEYRVLCHNCNMATMNGRVCPHQDFQ